MIIKLRRILAGILQFLKKKSKGILLFNTNEGKATKQKLHFLKLFDFTVVVSLLVCDLTWNISKTCPDKTKLFWCLELILIRAIFKNMLNPKELCYSILPLKIQLHFFFYAGKVISRDKSLNISKHKA